MIQKLFPLDKNYILRQAQSVLEEPLLDLMVFELKRSYTFLYNPLGLVDDTYGKILDSYDFPKERLKVIYYQLCGIYRFKFGDNQLELLFDGRTHFEKFQEDWSKALIEWVRELGTHDQYVKTLLRMTILYDTESRAEWAENHFKAYVNDFFELKIIKGRVSLN